MNQPLNLKGVAALVSGWLAKRRHRGPQCILARRGVWQRHNRPSLGVSNNQEVR